MDTIYFILIISILGPVIGSLIGVIKKPSYRFMYNLLGFAAGVMLAISFLQLIPQGIELSSLTYAIAGIILGTAAMYALDRLIPHIHPELCKQEQGCKLKRTALYLIIGIFLHNFPEGMAIGIGTVTGMKNAIVVALAIAIHNIPEGICTSAPYYYSNKKKLKSFLVSSLTAVPLIVGFFFAHFLYQHISLNLVGMLISATAGIMIYISADELIPCSCGNEKNNGSHSTIFSLIAGVLLVVMLGYL